MAVSFSIYPEGAEVGETQTLRDQLAGRTASDAETASIMRSIERYGEDRSIQYFEVTLAERRLGSRDGDRVAWSVRAVRAEEALDTIHP